MMMSRLKNSLALAGIVGAVAAAGVVGAVASHDADSREARAVGVGKMSTPADVHHEATKLYMRFMGTETQRNAGYVVKAAVLNGPMDRCMEEAGFPEWDWSGVRQYAGPQDALEPTVWFKEPHARFRSDRLMSQVPLMRGEARANVDYIPADLDAAIGKCLNSTPSVSDETAEDASMPAGTLALMDEWWTDFRNAGMRLGGDILNYTSCMNRADIPLLEMNNAVYADLAKEISALTPDLKEIPTSADDPAADSPGWQRLLRAEDTINDADWTCRGDVYERSVMDLAPVIEQFAAEHSEEIAQSEAEWEHIEAEAAALGYDGTQVGPLGG